MDGNNLRSQKERNQVMELRTHDFDSEELTNFVKQHRRVVGMTQKELAERVGVTRQTILSIEKGKYTPSVALALHLAEVFEVRVEDLFRRGDAGKEPE